VRAQLNLADNGLCGVKNGAGKYTAEGIEVIADALRANGSLTVLNLLCNELDVETATMLAGIAKEKRISLCGIKPDKASASFFNTNLKHSDAILLVSDLTQAGVCKSLTKLNVRSNELGNEGEAMIRRAVEGQKGFVLEM
jgi:hypothetical protein